MKGKGLRKAGMKYRLVKRKGGWITADDLAAGKGVVVMAESSEFLIGDVGESTILLGSSP